MKNKRGVSGVIVALFLVLLVLVSVVIFWAVIKPLLAGSAEKIGLTQACLEVGVEATKCTYAGSAPDVVATVLYKRGANIEYTLDNVKLSFMKPDGTTSVIDADVIPEVLETVSNSSDLDFVPAEVSAVAVLLDEDGKQHICTSEGAKKVSCDEA